MRRGLVRWLVRIGLLAGCLALGPLAGGAWASNLLYYGGPVVHSANVILVQWGSHDRASYINPTTGDPGFFRYLASQSGSTSDIGGVLAQYMDTTGHNSQNAFSYGGSFQISPSVGATPPANVQDSNMQTELAQDIASGALPAPSGDGLSTVYVVLFPPNDDVCFDGGGGCAYDTSGGFCAYHGSFASGATQVLYAAMPDNGSGTPNYGFCGASANDLQNQTSVVSHELAESINDPLVSEASTYGPPLGWYDAAQDGEIADKCDVAPLAQNGPWTVEPLWSNVDANCMSREPAFSAPTASFLAPSSPAPGQPASFNAASSSDPAQNHVTALEQGLNSSYSISSGITRYRWNWGDGSPGSTSSSATASHVFAAAGDYQVSLTVTDDLGFTSTSTRQVSVTGGGPVAPGAETDAATLVDGQHATLNGQVNPQGQPVSYWFAYGTSAGSLAQTTPSTPGPGGQSPVSVSATLSGLAPSTTYYYELVVSAGTGTYTGSVQRFTTSASSGSAQTPVVATGPAARVSASGALLTGTVNPGGPDQVTYAFAYGTSSTALSQSTPSSALAGGTSAVPVTATLTGLHPRTRYYVRLSASLNGQTYSGPIRSFTTRRALPGVRTGSARQVISNSAVVSGWVNPHGTATVYQVQFGPTSSYGYSTTFVRAGSTASSERVSSVLFGLRPSSTYHYRLVAQNDGGTVVGSDRTFTTARRLAAAPRFRFRSPGRVSWRHLQARQVRVRFHCSRACTAHFVLTVVRAGISRIGAVPLTIARGRARLARPGAGVATLNLASRTRSRRVVTQTRALRVLLLGYAVAAHSSASAPEQARVSLF
jgi:hypothetical protein